jgi:hypothetical protein
MNYSISIIFLTFIISTSVLAQKNKRINQFDNFCSGVSTWPKGQDVREKPGIKVYKAQNIGNITDAEFTLDKLYKDGWLVIDARDKATRRTTGKVVGSLSLVSDYNSIEKNQFELKNLLRKFSSKKFNKHLLKRKLEKVEEAKDLREIKFILFCNGFKCHRSSFAACKLREYGVPFENIYLNLGGFDSLKKAKAKIR